ncbi:uncharacterized protein [Hetaerina americana]|uniref:uncharacterized protein n=1 Tax=Hetaerina americana TaxID=62018 RepID=UPI003A7F508B
MSVSNPLLRELKGYVLHLVQDSVKEEITDQYEHLQPLCQILENILQQGLFHSYSIGYKGAESWNWLEKITEDHYGATFSYNAAVEEVRNCRKVVTPRGKLRLLIRTCLNKKCLHVPVEAIVRYKYPTGVYQTKDSILGDEILGEIFLSVLLQCSKIAFRLCLKNAIFLDETWQLAEYVIHEFVPCKILGLNVGFVRERGVVVGVEESGVAGEDDKVEIGDLVDELNGHWIRATQRGRLSSYMKQAEGKPITLNILKGHNAVGELYPPIVRLLGKLQVDTTALEARFKAKLSSKEQRPISGVPSTKNERAGIPVRYLGIVSTGNRGDVNQIDRAITAVLRNRMSKIKSGEKSKEDKEEGQFEIQDMGIQVSSRQTGKIFLKHSYMEISSCGGRSDLPDHFAYIAGETSCNVAKSFNCYVFHCPNEDQIRLILQSIGQGFQRTHWAV